MGFSINDCPRGTLPASLTEQNCEVNFFNIRRLSIIHADGTNPFTGVDAAAQAAEIVLQSAWTDAIALTDEDRLFLTPRARGSNMEAGSENFETREDQSRILTFIGPSSLTMKFYGLTSDNEEAMRQAFNGTGYKFGLILNDGKFVGYDVENANHPGTAGSKEVFFPVETAAFKDRTGANLVSDYNELILSYEYGTIKNWTIYDTSAFGLAI